MANSYFKFKQFTINQDKTAMKVGTDGVLLGAWTDVDRVESILDIGTGTGLIAIMFAQRSNAKIDAIEIDKNAYLQALENVQECKWMDRIKLYHSSIQDYCTSCNRSYDLIVSNPPYFQNSLHAAGKSRTVARHNDSLSYDELLNISMKLLTAEGKLSLVLPYIEGSVLIAKASDLGLFCTRKTNVLPLPGRKPKRLLVEFSKQQKPLKENELVIENNKRHDYSDDYKTLTREFYLKF